MVGDSTRARLASLAGHAALRLLDDDSDDFNDLVIGFEMLVIDDQKILEKINGGWEHIVKVETMIEKIVDYAKLDGRPIQRIIIPSDEDSIQKLIENLNHIVEVGDLVGDYSFFFNNCLSALLKTLSASGFPVEKGLIDIPIWSSSILRSQFLYPFPALDFDLPIRTLRKIKDKFILAVLRREDRWIGTYYKDEDYWRLVEDASEVEIEILFHFWPPDWSDMKNRISRLYSKIPPSSRTPLNDLINIQKIPPDLYRICNSDDLSCRQRRIELALGIWSRKDLLEHNHGSNFLFERRLERNRNNQVYTKNPIVKDVLEFEWDVRSLFDR